jgi:hypothetical protein
MAPGSMKQTGDHKAGKRQGRIRRITFEFSCHYEADLDRGGASVLDIRPLLWKNGWPVAAALPR